MDTTETLLRHWVGTEGAGLALPGSGRTWARFSALADLCAVDLSAGRLAEGHADALAILHELGAPAGDGLYGVWAARPDQLRAEPEGDGWRLAGAKPFCSGAGLLDRALVVAVAPEGARLFDLDVRGATGVAGSWPAVGMAGSRSGQVEWPGEAVGPARAVGPPGSYTGRIGFWWGASGVAACWWGGARGLVGCARDWMGSHAGESELAALGRAAARVVAMERLLFSTAACIDARSGDIPSAQHDALVCRQVVHEQCVAVLADVAAAGGAGPICLDPAQSRRSADLYAYLAQHHGGRDAAALGRMVLAAGRCLSGPSGGASRSPR